MYCLNIFFVKNNFLLSSKKNKLNILFDYGKINYNNIIFRRSVINKKYVNFLFKFNKKNYFFFNDQNRIWLTNFISVIQSLIVNNMKIFFISSDSKLLLPYYSNIFSVKSMYSYKNYIFYDYNLVNYFNWQYFMNNFLLISNVKTIFFLNYSNLNKFIKIYSGTDFIKLAVVYDNILSFHFDYYFFCGKEDKKFITLFISNYIISFFFINLNIKNMKNKYLFSKTIEFINKKLILII